MPVLDLRKRLGLPEETATRATRVIVIEKQENTVGFIVDRVLGVMRLAKEDIEPPTQIVSELDTSYLRGVGKRDGELILLLDMECILEMGRNGKGNATA
jgi:purine-binding chemotaxis protein CheW